MGGMTKNLGSLIMSKEEKIKNLKREIQQLECGYGRYEMSQVSTYDLREDDKDESSALIGTLVITSKPNLAAKRFDGTVPMEHVWELTMQGEVYKLKNWDEVWDCVFENYKTTN